MNSTTDPKEKLSRREREKAQHRQEIMDAAIKVFSEKGFAATLDEVAQKADFSKGALYLYFSSKEDLLLNIINYAFEGWFDFFNNTVTGKKSLKKELTILFNEVAGRIFEHPDLFPLISAQHASLFKALSEEKESDIIKLHDNIWESVKLRVIKAVEDCEIRNIEPEAVVGLIHGSMEAMVHNRWNCESSNELKNGINIFMDIIFNGMSSRKETHQ